TKLPDLPTTGETESKSPLAPEKNATESTPVTPKAEEKSTAPKSSSEKSAAPKGSEQKSDATKKSDDKKSSGKQSSLRPNSDSLDGELLAFADAPATPAEQKSEPPAAKSAATATETKAAETKKGGANPAETKAADAATPPVEYEPLSKVSDAIHNRLAQQ